ncbi:hypothetical protein MG293_012724 [Ovis ammon polii]|uniref:Neurogenic mastermind-like N-terminal domain-containing protein n=1 Tax=Ovis ammon polii TaxID=230172 RepID=A0AAD4U2C4_OVIAM|nr:hypothetical protein MG293_012724 [Ovis ammon polii]
MGDTAPPQAPTGGLGGAPGAGLLGGGSVTPRVHSAIVERLRARIAVCRQHHLSCEGRYERGRAESSDRERESTLQLLSLVQHGQGARKAGKHTKATASSATATAPPPAPAAPPTASQTAAPAAPAPPPDYHHHHQQHLRSSSSSGGSGGIDGEPQQQPPASTPGDQRNSALIAFCGCLGIGFPPPVEYFLREQSNKERVLIYPGPSYDFFPVNIRSHKGKRVQVEREVVRAQLYKLNLYNFENLGGLWITSLAPADSMDMGVQVITQKELKQREGSGSATGPKAHYTPQIRRGAPARGGGSDCLGVDKRRRSSMYLKALMYHDVPLRVRYVSALS